MRFNLKILVHVSILVAAEVVLSRFLSISTPVMKIGLGFVPIAVCAMLYGPVWAAAAGALADFIGAVLFPIGAYFPGFTLSAALTGVIFGLFLYGGAPRLGAALAAAGLNCLAVVLLLGALWLSILMGTGFYGLLPARALQAAVMLPIQTGLLYLLHRPVLRLAKII